MKNIMMFFNLSKMIIGDTMLYNKYMRKTIGGQYIIYVIVL
jgi:hypothetical protein